MAWRRLLFAAWLCGATACSYDLGRLRGTSDASADGAVTDGSVDGTSDTSVDDVPDDTLVTVDTGPDVGFVDSGDPMQCLGHAAPNAADVGTWFGGSLVISGDTVGQSSRLDPPTSPGCPSDYASNPSPDQVYRYVVTTGPNLQATTDAPDCAGAFDTVVYIRTSCTAGGTTLVCNDDDSVLADCNTGTGSAGGLTSTATATGLSPGQVVYVVVDGFGGNAGRFRLTLTENGVASAPPPVGISGLAAADRCACPSSLDSSVISTPFPTGVDVVSAVTPPTLARANDAIGGTHDVMGLTQVGGAGLAFQLVSNRLGVGGAICSSVGGVTVDVMVHDVAVHSFLLDAHTPVGSLLRVPFQQFGDVPLAGSTSVGLRVREGSPSSCGGVVVDTGVAESALTLLGTH